MKIGQFVLGFQVFAILPDASHKGIFHLAGSQPGNKRPIYATWEVNVTAAGGHHLTPERVEVFSSAAMNARERKTEAMTSLLTRSGCYSEVDDHMQAFWHSVTSAEVTVP